MPKLPCPCGHVHDLSPIPDHGASLVPHEALASVLESNAYDDREAAYLRTARLVYGCPACGRLLVERPDGSGRYMSYRPEDPLDEKRS